MYALCCIMLYYCIVWLYCIVLHASYCIVLYYVVLLYCIVCIILYRIVTYCISIVFIWYCMHYIVLYLNCYTTVLYCMHYIVLLFCYMYVLHCIILYYYIVLLYCIVKQENCIIVLLYCIGRLTDSNVYGTIGVRPQGADVAWAARLYSPSFRNQALQPRLSRPGSTAPATQPVKVIVKVKVNTGVLDWT